MKEAPPVHLLKSMTEVNVNFPGFGDLTDVDTPEVCMMCGAEWRGGATEPGEKMKQGCRAFYACGASHSVRPINPFSKDKMYLMLMKNCFNTDGGEHEDDKVSEDGRGKVEQA